VPWEAWRQIESHELEMLVEGCDGVMLQQVLMPQVEGGTRQEQRSQQEVQQFRPLRGQVEMNHQILDFLASLSRVEEAYQLVLTSCF